MPQSSGPEQSRSPAHAQLPDLVERYLLGAEELREVTLPAGYESASSEERSPSTEKVPELLTGSYSVKIDAKHRIAIPAAFRASFANEPLQLMKSPFPDERAVFILTEREFRGLWQSVLLQSSDTRNARAALLALTGVSHQAQADRNGRIVLPAAFIEHLELQPGQAPDAGVVVIAGMGNHLELWTPSRWKEQLGAGPR